MWVAGIGCLAVERHSHVGLAKDGAMSAGWEHLPCPHARWAAGHGELGREERLNPSLKLLGVGTEEAQAGFLWRTCRVFTPYYDYMLM